MSRIGSVYGAALYELAVSEKLEKPILDQLKVLSESFEDKPDFIRLLSVPVLSKEERCKILDNSFRGKIEPYVLNFLKILTNKGHIRHFSDCYLAYRNLYNRDNGILPVTAVTAIALSSEQSERLKKKLSGITGMTIELINEVDSSCLGGVRLDFDGKQLDDTISHRLEAIRSQLSNTVL